MGRAVLAAPVREPAAFAAYTLRTGGEVAALGVPARVDAGAEGVADASATGPERSWAEEQPPSSSAVSAPSAATPRSPLWLCMAQSRSSTDSVTGRSPAVDRSDRIPGSACTVPAWPRWRLMMDPGRACRRVLLLTSAAPGSR